MSVQTGATSEKGVRNRRTSSMLKRALFSSVPFERICRVLEGWTTERQGSTMANSEVTVASTGYANISIGPGGRIEDPLLLEKLGRGDPLPPRDLLKLATLFQADPSSTNAFLGERLLLTALTTIVIDPRLQEGIEAIMGQDFNDGRDTLD